MEQQNKYRVIVSERATQMLIPTPHFWHRSAQKRQNGSQPSLKRPQIP